MKLTGLGYDATPPTGVAFADEDPADPARLNVRASDDVSGIAGGAIEVRRAGGKLWRPLDDQVTPSGLTAMIDDEHLRRGVYDLRAVAVNGAGLQQGTDRRQDGLPARIKLPVRAASRLVAGRARRRPLPSPPAAAPQSASRGSTGAPRVRVGRSSLLRGQLKIRGKAVKRRVRLEVFSRRLGSTQWKQLRPIRTSEDAAGSATAPAAGRPARSASATPARARSAATTRRSKLRVARLEHASAARGARVVNGEYVTFRGRLRGGWVPAAGALVELQVYARGVVAHVRAARAPTGPAAGATSTASRRSAAAPRFRFRARIRRQTGYPFATGALAHRPRPRARPMTRPRTATPRRPRLSCGQGCVHQRRSDRP